MMPANADHVLINRMIHHVLFCIILEETEPHGTGLSPDLPLFEQTDSASLPSCDQLSCKLMLIGTGTVCHILSHVARNDPVEPRGSNLPNVLVFHPDDRRFRRCVVLIDRNCIYDQGVCVLDGQLLRQHPQKPAGGRNGRFGLGPIPCRGHTPHLDP